MAFPYPEAICLTDSWWFSCTAEFTLCKKQVKLLLLTNLCLVSVPHVQWCCHWIRQSYQRLTSCSAHGLRTLCQCADHRWTAVCHSPGPAAIKEDEKVNKKRTNWAINWHLWAIRYVTNGYVKRICFLQVCLSIYLSNHVFAKPDLYCKITFLH